MEPHNGRKVPIKHRKLTGNADNRKHMCSKGSIKEKNVPKSGKSPKGDGDQRKKSKCPTFKIWTL